MKQLIALGLLVGSMASIEMVSAESWEKILTCEGGAVHIDVNRDERRNLQLVFSGYDMLNRMCN